jgi:1,4-alpha-glucan branching enzyme
MIAEESTAFPGVTAPVIEGGLGFRLKWNMGFANDFFAYLQQDPLYRRYHHRALTFPMMYAYSERFILPVSHDEVVYGKGSLYRKCAGGHYEKMDTLRAALTFIMTFPGKKMLFMGTELGQENEWYYETGIDLHLLEREDHRSLRDGIRSHALCGIRSV